MADRGDSRPMKVAPIPLDTQQVTCVLRFVTRTEVPTSFGGKPGKEAKAWIWTNPKENSDLDTETINLVMQPKKTYTGQPHQASVEAGRVRLTHLYATHLTGAGIQSRETVYENGVGNRAIRFRDDSGGHLVLSDDDGERLHLDLGTGVLLRITSGGGYDWGVYTEAYSCRPTPP